MATALTKSSSWFGRQSNWKKSDKKKNSSYKYDKLYQQKVILPKLSEF